MLGEKDRICDICRRLGKSECGYHRFKNNFLAKMNGSHLRENNFSQTQSTMHGNSLIVNPNCNNISLSPERINRKIVTVQYPEPQPIQLPQNWNQSPIRNQRITSTPVNILPRTIEPQHQVPLQ